MKLSLTAGFVLTVWAANFAINHWGFVPVGFGLQAPAGVYFAGLGFLLRDALHELAGRGRMYALAGVRDEEMARVWVVGAILAGAVLSYLVGGGGTFPGGLVPLAAASAVGFLLSESADFAVYTPLRERTIVGAVGLSQIVGAAVDSALFLWLAFGSLAYFEGQFVGKTLMVLPALGVVAALRARQLRVAAGGAAE